MQSSTTLMIGKPRIKTGKNRDFAFITSVAVLCASISLLYFFILVVQNSRNPFIKKFPLELNGWTGKDLVIEKVVTDSLQPDASLYKAYEKHGKVSVTLFMACYRSGERSDLSHSPVVCSVGQGWEITSVSERKIAMPFSQTPIDVNQIIQNKLGTTLLLRYWYQTSRQAYSNRATEKLSLFYERLFGKQDSNAFVRLTAVIPQSGSVKEVEADMSSFLADFYPEIREFLQ